MSAQEMEDVATASLDVQPKRTGNGGENGPAGCESNRLEPGVRLAALRKKLVRRAAPDHSQHYRRAFQFAFLALNLWLGTSISGFDSLRLEFTIAFPRVQWGWKAGFPSRG